MYPCAPTLTCVLVPIAVGLSFLWATEAAIRSRGLWLVVTLVGLSSMFGYANNMQQSGVFVRPPTVGGWALRTASARGCQASMSFVCTVPSKSSRTRPAAATLQPRHQPPRMTS